MCILLVEDEAMIREIMAESLQDAGFEVMQAEDGERAADLIRHPPLVFSALVTDFHMPGTIDGAGVAECMRRCWPTAPVVIASGRPEVFRPHWQSQHGYGLLRKPYLPHQLVEMMRRLLPLPPRATP
ncbi:response regulator [Lichenicoccus roseus]|uniref:Response regulator n=1 Tax=Lichenicoccus roseus TaxID=2683649 RepID=A0A5R9J8Z1_9PROT|nr:response regulator [Lichenicoccus roseus]TLU73263.1 response regulator [Lichenicoccus roseus]